MRDRGVEECSDLVTAGKSTGEDRRACAEAPPCSEREGDRAEVSKARMTTLFLDGSTPAPTDRETAFPTLACAQP